jgi:orotidine-5'-phosphate decarboxylase
MSSKSYAARAEAHKYPLIRRLFQIMEKKQTNLALSADLSDTKSLLDLADSKIVFWYTTRNTSVLVDRHSTAIGPYIAIFKTHIDIVKDFGPDTVQGLKKLAEKHDFLIFEDRKFVDIGNTVKMQYRGALQIADWAHFVNASVLAGEGTVEGLKEVGQAVEFAGMRGLLILAEMSSKGNLATGVYTNRSVEIALKHQDFVVGFIAGGTLQEAVGSESDFVIMTPGINRGSRGDALGQQYHSPEMAIQKGSDIIIVGRGIYGDADPVQAAQLYQREGWEAYEKRINIK